MFLSNNYIHIYSIPYPPLGESSVLFPDRPELMESTVGESLSAILQEDRLRGRDRP